MSYTIRKIRTETERLTIALLNEKTFPADVPLRLLQSQAVYWIAREDSTGDPVGFTALFPHPRKPDVWLLERSGVLKQHRGKGLQKRFIKVRLAEAKRLGAKYVTSWTYHNPASGNNLIEAGFRMYKPTEAADRIGDDAAVYYRRKI